MSNNIPIAVNYTNRDFYSLRDDLVTRVQARVAENGKTWSANDPADFGVALVEAFAYVGDVTNYYIDRVANEGFIGTATQRQSILDIASLFGYTPAGYRQSSLTLSFNNYDTTNVVTVPAGTQLSVDIVVGTSNVQLYFTTILDVSIPSATDINTPGTATGLAFHGYSVDILPANAAGTAISNDIAGELLATSNGLTNQSYELSNNQVVDNSISIYVHDGNVFTKWNQVTHLADYGPIDTVYTVTTDSNNYVKITFGDGVAGAVPTLGSAIKAVYTVGGGLVGNIEANQSFNIHAVPVASGYTITDLASVKVSSSAAATGGEDPESNDSIRVNAPAAIRTLRRAVTLSDYKDLALAVPNVGKAFAKASQPQTVALYVAPSVSDVSTDYYPGFDAANIAPTTSWNTLATTVSSYFSDKTQIGVSVNVLPPAYIPVNIDVQYNKQDSYSHDQVISALKYSLVYGYGFNFLDFNQVIYPEQLESSMMLTPGVNSLKAIHLYRHGSSVTRSPLVASNGEYFVFRDEYVNVYPVASLSNLVTSSGTLSQAFASYNFAYGVTGVSTSTITITPTAWDSTNVITVNGTVVTSGTASSSISTPTGTTTITITVTTADGLSTNTYLLTVTR
jgi:hypothetical protein